MSHPVWVCGLKPLFKEDEGPAIPVTPCMGVWIETDSNPENNSDSEVTPCMGVWIETSIRCRYLARHSRHTLYGCVD